MGSFSLPIILASMKSVAAFALLFAWAAGLASNGIVDQVLLSRLAKLSKIMMIPSLTFHSIAGGLSPELLKEQWILSVAGAVVVATGMIVGHFGAIILRVPFTLRPWFVLVVAQPNLIALPLVLVEAICRESEESQANIATCIEEATTRLFTVTLLNSLIFWTFLQSYVQSYMDRAVQQDLLKSKQHNSSDEQEFLQDSGIRDEQSGSSEPAIVGRTSESANSSLEDNSLAPIQIEASPKIASTCNQNKNHTSNAVRICRGIQAGLLEPPSLACFLGIFFACVSPAHRLLYGHEAPASFITSVIIVVGKASPVMGAILTGGSFGLVVSRLRNSSETPFQLEALGASWRLVVLTGLLRVVVVPLACVGLLLCTLDILPNDRWSRLILFFQPAGVTANVVSVLAQLMDQADAAQFIGLVALPQIILYVPTSTVLIACGMAWGTW